MNLTARVVPTSDNSFCIAVQIAANKYRHYKVTSQFWLMTISQAATEDGMDQLQFAINTIRERVKLDMGQDVDIDLIRDPLNDQFSAEASRRTIALPESVFSPKTIKALKQRESKRLIYEYAENTSIFPDAVANFFDKIKLRYLAFPVHLINELLAGANKKLMKLYGIDKLWDKANSELTANYLDLSFDPSPDMLIASEAYNNAAKGKFFFKFINLKGSFMYKSTNIAYLARVCGEEGLDQSVEMLSKDLDKMRELGIIFGNLSMPKLIELNNTVGNGKKVYGVFAFPIVNNDRIIELTGKNNRNLVSFPTIDLQQLGIELAVYEGGVTGDYPYQNEIENTIVIDAKNPAWEHQKQFNNDEVTNAYLAQKEAQRKLLEKRIAAVKDITKKE